MSVLKSAMQNIQLGWALNKDDGMTYINREPEELLTSDRHTDDYLSRTPPYISRVTDQNQADLPISQG
jgi:hypothetical protein